MKSMRKHINIELMSSIYVKTLMLPTNATEPFYRRVQGFVIFLMTFYKINKYMDYLTWTRNDKYHNSSITLTDWFSTSMKKSLLLFLDKSTTSVASTVTFVLLESIVFLVFHPKTRHCFGKHCETYSLFITLCK